MRVRGKIVLVTGGAGGIGAACAALLAEEGAIVFVSDLLPEPPDDISADTYFRHDVSVASDWQRVVAGIVGQHGRLDVLAHCAGIEGYTRDQGLAMSEEAWTRVITVNLTGTFLGCKAVLPEMLKQGTGSMILFASATTDMATPKALAYGASKAGVAHLARSVAMLGARDGARVRCNSVHPGSIDTPMTERLFAAIAADAGVPVSTIEERFSSVIPLGGRGHPADIAHSVLYLASDESRYMTGCALKVDGGWSAKSAS